MSKFKQVLNEWYPDSEESAAERAGWPRGAPVYEFHDEEIILRDKDEINRITQWAKANNKPLPVPEADGSLETYITGSVTEYNTDLSDYSEPYGHGRWIETEYIDHEINDIAYTDYEAEGAGDGSFIAFLNKSENKKLRSYYESEMEKIADKRAKENGTRY